MGGSRNKLFGQILQSIEKKVPNGTLLDVGTGCGFFLDVAKRRGWTVKGIEPSAESVEMARRQSGLDVIQGTLKDFKARDRYDVITFINVLEYSAMPWREIDLARQLLKTGGLIYVRFVNGLLHSRTYRLGTRYGFDRYIDRFLVFHYYSFSPFFMRKLLNDKAFSDITIVNSPLSEGDPNKLFNHPTLANYAKRVIYSMAKGVEVISNGRLLLGTSLEVTAINTDRS
jgi:hypothetical protein